MSYIKERMHDLANQHAWEIVDNSKIGDVCNGKGWEMWQRQIEEELLEHFDVLDYLEYVRIYLGTRSNIYFHICKLAGDCFYENHDLSVLYGDEWED